jgi:putative ABC transport system permease protein
MFKLAVKSTLAKKRRLFGTALSVVLGIAFLSGTLVFTDTIGRTFDDLFAGIYAETDTYVRAESEVELEWGGSQRGRMPGSVAATVAAVPGVAEAQGLVGGFAQIVGADGDAIGNPGRGAPTLGMSYLAGALSPWQLSEGSRAPRPGELVVDRGSADAGDLRLGDSVTVLTQTGPHDLTLVGTARFGSVDSPGGASVAIFDLATAQELLLGGIDEIDAVMVDAEAGVSEAELTARVAAVLPAGIEALTGTQITEETQDDMREGLSFFNTFLLVFAAIGLVVACFTIYNTFQIIVTQRRQEMALLRSVGATRRQVLWAQLLEAVIVGVTASAIGLFAGVAVAGGLNTLMASFGIDIPGGNTVFEVRTAVVAMTVGTVVTIGSAVFPSMRASRVPPLAAIRDTTTEPGAPQVRRGLLQGGLLSAFGIGGFVAGLSGAGILWVGIGALLTFVGVFTLGPLIARPAARAMGAPVARASGVTGVLARQNAMRNPKRTARTGGALMVGVALVVAITVIAATAKDWVRDVFDDTFAGDFVVSTDTFDFGGLSPQLATDLNELPEVGVATGVRVGAARLTQDGDEGNAMYLAVDPVTAGELFDIGIVAGSLDDLDEHTVFLDDSEADSRHVGLGDALTFQFLDGSTRRLSVAGIYTEDDLAGQFVVSHSLHESTGTDQFDSSVYVAVGPGVDEGTARAAIAAVSDAYPNADLQSRSQYIDDQAAQVDQIVSLMYGLLGLAVLIALISIANSVSLSIHERTRELGLVRAVGMTRHQTASAVRWEAAIVALLGTGLGALLGLFFGWAVSVTLAGNGLTSFTVPVVAVVVIVAVGVIGGVIAAIRPSWRAAHLDVLRAIASE